MRSEGLGLTRLEMSQLRGLLCVDAALIQLIDVRSERLIASPSLYCRTDSRNIAILQPETELAQNGNFFLERSRETNCAVMGVRTPEKM